MCIAICRVSGQTQCTIENNDDRALKEKTDQVFYLDVNNAATCTGTITNWTVCYYGHSDSGINSYWATYAIYQKVGSGEDESYERVSKMFRAVRTNIGFGDGADGQNQIGFNCYTDFIDIGDSPLTVRAGDIVGACVFDPNEEFRHELNIVGEVKGQGESLMRADLGCTMDAIPSSILRNGLQSRNNRRLYIYANIKPGS